MIGGFQRYSWRQRWLWRVAAICILSAIVIVTPVGTNVWYLVTGAGFLASRRKQEAEV